MDTLKLTKPIVESLLSPTGRSKNGVLLKYAIHWDTELKGFGLRITVNGVKTFVLQHRVNGKDRRLTIGRFGPLTAEEARREARKLLGAIATGRDPVAERRQAACDAVTLGETFADYLRARSELRPKTVKDYERIMRASFGDWRKRPLLDISGDMVQKRHTALAEHHGKAWANLSMRVLRAVYNFAAANYEGVRGSALVLDNPVKRLSRIRAWYRIDRRETLIKPHQLKPWMEAVLALENPLARDYLQLVLLTGLRRSEALGIKWDDVDGLGRTLTVRDTKNRRDHTLPLPGYLAALLGAMPRYGAYVFEGPRGRLDNLRYALEEVARVSGVPFRIHDLRRTFATIADSLDIPGYAVKALLNHKGGADVTEGYIVVSAERLRDPMRKIADYVLKCAGIQESAPVVAFERRS